MVRFQMRVFDRVCGRAGLVLLPVRHLEPALRQRVVLAGKAHCGRAGIVHFHPVLVDDPDGHEQVHVLGCRGNPEACLAVSSKDHILAHRLADEGNSCLPQLKRRRRRHGHQCHRRAGANVQRNFGRVAGFCWAVWHFQRQAKKVITISVTLPMGWRGIEIPFPVVGSRYRPFIFLHHEGAAIASAYFELHRGLVHHAVVDALQPVIEEGPVL